MRDLIPGADEAFDRVLVEVHGANNVPQPCPVYISVFELRTLTGGIARLPIGTGTDADGRGQLERDATAWGDPVDWHGRLARPFLNYGSPFHKVAATFTTARSGSTPPPPMSAVLECWTDEPCDLVVRAFVNGRELNPASIHTRSGEWHSQEVPLSRESSGAVTGITNTAGIHGTGQIVVRSAAFAGATDGDAVILKHGSAATLAIRYRKVDPAVRSQLQVVVAWHRDGVQDVCRFFARELTLGPERDGTIELQVDRLGLTDGRYAITLMLTEPGYYDRAQSTFYAINPGVYCCLSRLFEVEIVDAALVGAGTLMVEEGRWSVR
jgi:homopolymeric O-antigen transport system ATP-binding protein